MYQKVELYNEPHSIIEKTSEAYCEMSSSEQGFLCGLIQKYSPKKIVEVGVAGGGTTAVIMNCLSLLKSDAKMYSVDLYEECYRKRGKQSGYQLEEVRDYLPNYDNHTFLLGKTLPHVIEKIGGDIDFVILDTVHRLPGELLDFLCILPYLKENAVVVMHDVTLNLGRNGNAYATKMVLDAAVGEKYFNYEEGIINIGAIVVSEETRKNIANVFSAFSITWQHFPTRSEILAYKKIYEKFYDKECMHLFNIFVKAQYNRYRKGYYGFVFNLKNSIRKFDGIYKLLWELKHKVTRERIWK